MTHVPALLVGQVLTVRFLFAPHRVLRIPSVWVLILACASQDSGGQLVRFLNVNRIVTMLVYVQILILVRANMVGLVQIVLFPYANKHVEITEIALGRILANVLNNGKERTVEHLYVHNHVSMAACVWHPILVVVHLVISIKIVQSLCVPRECSGRMFLIIYQHHISIVQMMVFHLLINTVIYRNGVTVLQNLNVINYT